jgi:hypothetical protein
MAKQIYSISDLLSSVETTLAKRTLERWVSMNSHGIPKYTYYVIQTDGSRRGYWSASDYAKAISALENKIY